MAGSHARIRMRRVQGGILLAGGTVQVAAFLVYMLPGMRDGTIDALLLLSPLLLGLAGPFALHWAVVRHPTVGAATAAVLSACAIAAATDAHATSEDPEALMWFVVVIGEVMIVGACAAVGLIATGTNAALGRRTSGRSARGT